MFTELYVYSMLHKKGRFAQVYTPERYTIKKIIGAVGMRTIRAHKNWPHPGYSRPAVQVLLPGYLLLNGFYTTKDEKL